MTCTIWDNYNNYSIVLISISFIYHSISILVFGIVAKAFRYCSKTILHPDDGFSSEYIPYQNEGRRFRTGRRRLQKRRNVHHGGRLIPRL